MFFIPTKIKNAMINILCTIFTYKDEGSGFWQALTKVILDFYIYNFHFNHCITGSLCSGAMLFSVTIFT